MSTPNPFRALRDLGYQNVLPIIPPGVELDPNTYLYLNIDTPQDGRGKAPGIPWSSGKWGGLTDWQNLVASDAQLDYWHSIGAGVGLRTGDGVLMIDIDAREIDRADAMEADAIARFGPAPLRIGAWPKRALVYRIEGSIPYETISYERGGQGNVPEEDRENDAIEFSAGKRQMVMLGTHAKTGQPYRWVRPLVPFDQLTMVSDEAVAEFKADWLAKLPKAVKSKTRKHDQTAPVQENLKGDLDLVAKAMRALPNTKALYPTYNDMIRVGEALHAATADDRSLGLELWHEWCEKWEGGDYTEASAERTWRTFDHEHYIGAGFLFHEAHEHSHKDAEGAREFDKSVLHFDGKVVEPKKIPGEVLLFDAAMTQQEESAPKDPPIKWVRPSEWAGQEPKPREWEVEGWIPRYEVCLLYGDGGIGKTLAIHQYATAAAAGLDWLGQKTRKAKVMCFFCEDSEDELLRRQIDINKSMGLTLEDSDSNLRIASRKYMDNLLILWDRNTGALKRQAVWEQLRNDAVGWGAEVIIVDTIADTFGGNEIDRAQVNAFIKSCLGRLAQEINGTVIALGHPSMSGKQSGSGTSGSTAWSNAVRSRIYLRYPKGVEKGNIRELEGMKLNYGAKGNLLKLRWHGGAFEVLAASVAPVSGESAPKVPHDGLLTVESASDTAVFDAVQAQAGLGVAMSLKPNSPHFAPKVLKRREPDLLAGYSLEEVETAFARLERRGALVEVEVGRKENRHSVMGYEVVPAAMFEGSTGEGGAGVFD